MVLNDDYTKIKEHKQTDDDGNLRYEDISEQVALAVWAMVISDIMQIHLFLSSRALNPRSVGKMLEFLKKEVCDYKRWERERSVQRLLAAIDSALSPQVESGEASETNHDEDSSAQPHAKRARTVKAGGGN